MLRDQEQPVGPGYRDLHRVERWCLLAGPLIIDETAGSTGLKPLHGFPGVQIVGIVASCGAAAGFLLSLYASYMALLGILFPCTCARSRFLLVFILSALPSFCLMYGPYILTCICD